MPNISEIRTGIDGNQTVDYDDGTTKVEVPVRFDKVTGELTSASAAAVRGAGFCFAPPCMAHDNDHSQLYRVYLKQKPPRKLGGFFFAYRI